MQPNLTKQIERLRASYLKVSDALEDYHGAGSDTRSADRAIKRLDRAMDEWNARFSRLLKAMEPK